MREEDFSEIVDSLLIDNDAEVKCLALCVAKADTIEQAAHKFQRDSALGHQLQRRRVELRNRRHIVR